LKKNAVCFVEESKIKRDDSATTFVIMTFPARLRALNLTLNHARDAAHTRADTIAWRALSSPRIRAWNPKSEKAALERPVLPRLVDCDTEIRFIRCWNSQGSRRKMRSLVSPSIESYASSVKVSSTFFKSRSRISNKYFSYETCRNFWELLWNAKAARINLQCLQCSCSYICFYINLLIPLNAVHEITSISSLRRNFSTLFRLEKEACWTRRELPGDFAIVRDRPAEIENKPTCVVSFLFSVSLYQKRSQVTQREKRGFITPSHHEYLSESYFLSLDLARRQPVAWMYNCICV